MTGDFSEALESELTRLAGTRPRVLPVSLDDVLLAIVRGNDAC